MNRRALKYPVVAALFSAAFLFGGVLVDAYTYDGVTSTLDTIVENDSDLIVDNKSSIIVKGNVTPKLISITSKVVDDLDNIDSSKVISYEKNTISTTTQYYKIDELQDSAAGPQGGLRGITIDNLPQNISQNIANEILNVLRTIPSTAKHDTSSSGWTWNELTELNTKYNMNISVVSRSSRMVGYTYQAIQYIGNNYLQYKDGQWSGTDRVFTNGYGYIINNSEKTTVYDGKYIIKSKKELGDASITVSKNSTLMSKENIQTSKAINVTGTSKLNTATGRITGGTISSDGDIIAQSNYSAPDGKSTISAASITSSGALTASKDIKATTGSISGSVIQATNGNVVANNTIKATGKVKGNALNVGVINASSASITGNQSISGIFTTTGQAKLNGGAKLGNKKITGLSAGTLSATSTEAVNGTQLNTIKQKLASAGKSYTAGPDIAISSANAISVAKTGAVKSGDTGIVTGGTVYTETNSLNTKINGLKDLVNSHQTTISSLQQQMGDLNQTISDINSNVASATSNLSNQLKNCLKSDMGNLSAAGKTAIKNIVSDSLKSMGRQSSQTLTSPVATFEAPGAKDTVNAKDVESVHTTLTSKLDKSALSDIKSTVDTNTKQISSNTNNIRSNASSIEALKSGKSDVSGSNIDIPAYASQLGTGSVAKGDIGLVSGDTVYGALDKKVDISYVDSGIGMMENQMAGIKQQATHDMNRVGAGASALTGLHPTAYDASDKLSFASGYGHYKNANTTALGAFYHPNDKTMVSVAGTIGNNHAMLSVGVSIKLGISDHVAKVIVTPKMFSAQEVANQDMRDHLDTQSERIRQIEKALQNR